MDGSGSLFGTVCGNTREILYKFSVDLPKKHGRGGQSALRFARLRLEKRHNYLRKVAELSVVHFIDSSTSRPNVSGLILAGLAEFKNDLHQSDMFDQRLQKIVIKTVDTSYGFENGFNQAIELSKDTLKNVKFIQEKQLISKFFEEIAQDTKKYCFGIRDTLFAIDSSGVQTLIVYENLEINRIVVGTPSGDKILYLTPAQEKNSHHFKDPETGSDLDIKEKVLYVEWLAENYTKMGFSLQFVTENSQEGSQFVKGFGGIGCLLRFVVDFSTLDTEAEVEGEAKRVTDSYEDDEDYDYIY